MSMIFGARRFKRFSKLVDSGKRTLQGLIRKARFGLLIECFDLLKRKPKTRSSTSCKPKVLYSAISDGWALFYQSFARCRLNRFAKRSRCDAEAPGHFSLRYFFRPCGGGKQFKQPEREAVSAKLRFEDRRDHFVQH